MIDNPYKVSGAMVAYSLLAVADPFTESWLSEHWRKVAAVANDAAARAGFKRNPALSPAYQGLYALFANASGYTRDAPFTWGPLAVRALWRRQLPAGVVHSPPAGISASARWESPAQAQAVLDALLSDGVVHVASRDRAGRPTSYAFAAPIRNPALPEDPWRYFTRPAGTELVPLALLDTIRVRPTGIENAAKYMRGAYEGTHDKRKPVSLQAKASGRFEVLDGNSTVANARANGWHVIPAIVERRTNPTVSIHSTITPASYPGVFRDAGHGVPAVDDPYPDEPCPTGAPCPDTVEEVKLSDEIRELIKLRQGFEGLRKTMDDRLRALAPGATVKSRTKTPFSIVNKLRRKRILGAHGLTDIVGTMLVLKDQAEVDDVVKRILGGALGEVMEHEDFYATPQAGYRAHHFIVAAPEGKLPVEVQVKTKRQSALSMGSHTPYKEGRLHAEEMDRLATLAYRADRGDARAAKVIDPLLADPHQLERRLTR